MLTILLVVLVICVLLWATRSLLSAFGVGEPISTVVMVVVVLIGLIYLLQHLGMVNLARL